MSNPEKKVTIVSKNREVTIFLNKKSTEKLFDQAYDVFSGEIDDNCIEIISENGEHVIIRADEIVYLKSQEVI